MPQVSVVIPIYQMDNAQYFLERNLKSIYIQSMDDYEIVVSDDSNGNELEDWLKTIDMPIKYVRNTGMKGMANNTNNGLDNATGELIKILYQDDYFYDSRSLEEIVKHLTPNYDWFVTGCYHTMDGTNLFNHHKPYYSESENTIGSPSVVTIRQSVKERFDVNFGWVLDLDFYRQLYRSYGKPKVWDRPNVVIGIGTHQETNKLSDYEKAHEHQLLKLKYEQATKD